MEQNKKNLNFKYDELIKKGLEFFKDGNIKASTSIFIEAININQKDHKAYINLSNIYILTNKIEDGTNLLLEYLKNNGFNNIIADHLGKICLNYNLEKKLNKLFKIVNLDTLDNIEKKTYIYFLQGKYYEKIKQFKKATKAYKNSILSNEPYIDSFISLLSLLEKLNDIEQLEKFTEMGLEKISNNNNKTYLFFFQSLILSRKKKYAESNNSIRQNNLFNKLTNDKEFILKVFDLSAKNYEKLENYDEAFTKISERNNIEKKFDYNKKFQQKNILDTLDKYKIFYNQKNINFINNKLKYHDDSNLVFLVGFPRSGTTLLDTILRTHTMINVLEEKPVLLNLRHNFFKNKDGNLNSLLKITQHEKDLIRKKYFNEIGVKKSYTKKIIIDKLPLSIIELGFIKCIFPSAKIILALRHPCDVVTSCFFSSFKINEAMINFLDWDDTIYFYHKVFSLFEFFEKNINLDYYSIKYENVVNNFKKEIGHLLDFLKLDYEKNLEKFYITAQNREIISTPSYTQVINPLYKTSIGKWKNYTNIKDPEKNLKKWINKFNY